MYNCKLSDKDNKVLNKLDFKGGGSYHTRHRRLVKIGYCRSEKKIKILAINIWLKIRNKIRLQ